MSFKVSNFQEFQEIKKPLKFQNLNGVSKFQKLQSFKTCLEIFGKFQSFEFLILIMVSKFQVSKFMIKVLFKIKEKKL